MKSDFPLKYKHIIFLQSLGTACFHWRAGFIPSICTEDMIFSAEQLVTGTQSHKILLRQMERFTEDLQSLMN